jgi:hypothetical protein
MTLPKIGCSVCLADWDGLAGLVRQPRAVKPCECRTRREQAKKAAVQ